MQLANDGRPESCLTDLPDQDLNAVNAGDLLRIAEELSARFPGRKDSIKRLLGHIAWDPVFVLHGLAGTGKSDILRSGVSASKAPLQSVSKQQQQTLQSLNTPVTATCSRGPL